MASIGVKRNLISRLEYGHVGLHEVQATLGPMARSIEDLELAMVN